MKRHENMAVMSNLQQDFLIRSTYNYIRSTVQSLVNLSAARDLLSAFVVIPP